MAMERLMGWRIGKMSKKERMKMMKEMMPKMMKGMEPGDLMDMMGEIMSPA
jgi:hypothetical protein